VQTPRTQPPEGRQLEAADGDIVIVDGDARVSVVRRRQAMVRVVADETNRFVLVLADWGTMASPDPDGTVNYVWRFTGTDGHWPPDHRWQAPATMLMPDFPGRSVSALSIETPAGVVAFMGGPRDIAPPANVAAVIHFTGMTGGGREGLSFDDAERDAMSPNFMSSVSSASMVPPGIAFSGERMTFETGSALQPGTPPSAQPATPRSAASSPSPRFVRPPQLIRRVDPQRSDAATAAGAQGFVILEVSIALDGTVSAARVLRSIPLLDEAALAAVRQWRYAPAGPEGRPDPLVTTVVVPFPRPR
jgi:TonB family protein